jgi:hypothetical protein
MKKASTAMAEAFPNGERLRRSLLAVGVERDGRHRLDVNCVGS